MERTRLEDERPEAGIVVDHASVVHDAGDVARKSRDLLKRYGVALALSGLALGIRAALPVPVGTTIYQLPIVAVVLSGWLGGRGPGLFASIICVTGVWYWFLPPVNTLDVAAGYQLPLAMFIGLCLLLTEFSGRRRRTAHALRASEERFRTLMQFSFDVYWETDAEHRFTRQEFSERLADAPARSSEIGKTRWEVPYLEPDAEAWRKHRKTLDAHLPFRDFELARPTPDGGKRYISVSGLPVFDEIGHFTGYRGVGRHITERKQAEQALHEARTELAHVNRVTTMGQLTASIAHEVNQPIAAAVINAQAALRWLRASPPNLDEVRQSLGQIIESGGRAGDVIDRIRALIKKAPPRTSRFDLNEAILDVIAVTRSEVLKHGVALQAELATSLPFVDGDRVQLQQVILNLIMNAAEAMNDLGEQKRELLISTQMDAAGDILVAVRDSGPGLDPTSARRVFEAFYTTKSTGLGMGLAICRSIIETHGGRLWASANEPRGAVFQFTLPPKRDEAVPAEQAY